MNKTAAASAPLQEAASLIEKNMAEIRQRITETADEITWLETSPAPIDEQREHVAAAVAQAAAMFEFAPVAGDLLTGAGLGSLFKVSTNVAVIARDGVASTTVTHDLSPVLCRLIPDAVKSLLCTALDELSFEAGPPTAERPALIAGARERQRALEIEEEILISDAEAAGMDVARRPDADPAIVLSARPMHVYRFRAVPVSGEYHTDEIESDTKLSRAEIRQRARHALPATWTSKNELEFIEILEGRDTSDILDGAEPDPFEKPKSRLK